MKTATAVSSGGIVFRYQKNKEVEVALVARSNPSASGNEGRAGKKIWCLPKGLVEKGESLEEAAVREVKEETGLSGEIMASLDQIDYWFYWKEDQTRYHKFVHFFLMKYTGGRLEEHDFEMEEVRWVPISKAIQMLNYKSEKEIMEKARDILKKRKE